MSIRIVSDSTCDLPISVTKKYRITVLPCYIHINGESYLDGIELSRKSFYNKLKYCNSLPTTAAPGINQFINAYNELAKEGADNVISIHVSANLSNLPNVARLAAQETITVPVTVIETGQLTLGVGLLVLAAAKAAINGAPLSDIISNLKKSAVHTYTFALLDTLINLRQSGRVSHLKYRIGTLLDIKPILILNNGIIKMEMVRTRTKALNRLLELVSKLEPLEQLAVVHTNAPDRADSLCLRAQTLFPNNHIYFKEEVTPVIGAHVGPGGIGFVCIAQQPVYY